ncbi:antiterminator Q family protein [Psychrobacter sp. APC 3426]|uniref:antiterminator Q family protein n=1 Tax=Psychrobacter sp. APC 3426 TaxID=3035177 RepID=UPI0025B4C7D3|nr:antiterminator Q family protein [Psychrobacter sp. APC 3426]MDN3398741.1 antiterminator Q family protein [Psychrobacter sp. APC 3426]
MAISLDLEVQNLLASWGHWVLADGTGLGYKSPMAMLMRGHIVEKSKARTTMFITDDEALKVEGLITILCEHKPLEGKILLLKYVERMSASSIAKHYLTPLKYGKDSEKQVSSYQAAQYIANAEGFITGLILNKIYKQNQ